MAGCSQHCSTTASSFTWPTYRSALIRTSHRRLYFSTLLLISKFLIHLDSDQSPGKQQVRQGTRTVVSRLVMAISPQNDNNDAISLFEKLGICRQLAEAAASLGWKAPTSIQEQAVPHLLAGQRTTTLLFGILAYTKLIFSFEVVYSD